MKAKFLTIAFVLLLGDFNTRAQSSGRFTMVRSVIAGGGTTFSTGGNFKLGSTIGQPTAGLLTGTRYSVQGGFWINPPFRIFAPTKGANSFSVSIETTAGRTSILECTDSLSAPNWQIRATTLGDGAVQTLTDPATDGHQRYYRIRDE